MSHPGGSPEKLALGRFGLTRLNPSVHVLARSGLDRLGQIDTKQARVRACQAQEDSTDQVMCMPGQVDSRQLEYRPGLCQFRPNLLVNTLGRVRSG